MRTVWNTLARVSDVELPALLNTSVPAGLRATVTVFDPVRMAIFTPTIALFANAFGSVTITDPEVVSTVTKSPGFAS
jgi:hypothetical protein